MRVLLRCMKQSIGDVSIHLKLIKGEKQEDVWTYYGYCVIVEYDVVGRNLDIVLLLPFLFIRIHPLPMAFGLSPSLP